MPSIAQRHPSRRNIFLAASDNDADEVQLFLNEGVDVNALDENGYSTMHAAASYNHIDLLDLLVSLGGNVNLQDFDGDTPLYVAETREMVAALISHGADVGHRNKEGKTALEHHAEEDEFPDVVAALRSDSAGGEVSASYTQQDEVQRTLDAMDGLPLEARQRIGEIMRMSSEDGVDRDEELRAILADALLGHQGQDRSRQRVE